MPEYTTPGVYVVEQSGGPHTLVGAPTSIAAFVGVAASGPRLEPTSVRSFAEFENVFAAGHDALAVGRHGRKFALGVRGYFDNGGQDLVVVNIRSFNGPELSEALRALESAADVSTVAAPAAAHPEQTYASLIAHAESQGRVALLDPPRGSSLQDLLALRATFDSTCAAFYAPRVVVADAPRLALAPSSFGAGVCARVDSARGVWKARANESLQGVTALEFAWGDAEQNQLNPQGINALRVFPGLGPMVWGARMATSNPERRYVSVQRTVQFVTRTLERGLSWAVFEPNDEPLWARMRASIENFLDGLWRAGALQGAKLAEGGFVRCDRTTMTQADIDARRAIVEVGLALTRPAEFLVLRLVVRTG